jgi:ABC-type uncharacterized transport system substrate-binding protein
MKRRDFIALVGAAAVRPVVARAEKSAVPVVGYLSYTSPGERPTLLAAFLRGLEQAGYVAGQNVKMEYRSADGHYERLPALAAELTALPVAVIAATGGEASGRAAKGVKSQIPIVFTTGGDPVKAGLVESLNRPGGNATGMSLVAYELDAKRIQMLHELVPKAKTVGVLVNAKSPSVPSAVADMQSAADATGLQLVTFEAGADADLEATFSSLRSRHIDALLITTNPFYEGKRQQIVTLAQHYSVPVLYPWREYTVAGGLISYGANFTEFYRQAGLYAGRILNGEKAADLPVVEATKLELLVNLKTARALGVEVPTALQLRADEVIE